MPISDKDIEYVEKRVKNELKSVTAKVSGKSQKVIEELGMELSKTKESLKLLKEAEKNLASELKEYLGPLFAVTDDAITRYVETNNLLLTLSVKFQKEYTEFDVEGAFHAMYELYPDLREIMDNIRNEYTTTEITPEEQSLRVKEKPKEPKEPKKVNESIGYKSGIRKLLDSAYNFYKMITRKLDRFDNKFDAILIKYDL